MSGARWVSNFDGTRHFLIVGLTKPGRDQLQTLLSVCNTLARKFELPELYAHQGSTAVGVPKQPSAAPDQQEVILPPQSDDKFHISIAWTLVKPEHNTCILDEEIRQQLSAIRLSFQEVLIKIGNIISNVHLRDTIANESNEA